MLKTDSLFFVVALLCFNFFSSQLYAFDIKAFSNNELETPIQKTYNSTQQKHSLLSLKQKNSENSSWVIYKSSFAQNWSMTKNIEAGILFDVNRTEMLYNLNQTDYSLGIAFKIPVKFVSN